MIERLIKTTDCINDVSCQDNTVTCKETSTYDPFRDITRSEITAIKITEIIASGKSGRVDSYINSGCSEVLTMEKKKQFFLLHKVQAGYRYQ